MRQFKEYVDRECKGCKHIRYCRGGCPYNAIAPNNGEIKGVDPHCIAYQRIFDEISDRFNKEMMGSFGMGMGMGMGMTGPGNATCREIPAGNNVTDAEDDRKIGSRSIDLGLKSFPLPDRHGHRKALTTAVFDRLKFFCRKSFYVQRTV